LVEGGAGDSLAILCGGIGMAIPDTDSMAILGDIIHIIAGIHDIHIGIPMLGTVTRGGRHGVLAL